MSTDREGAVIGTLLAESPDQLSPQVWRLIEAAPESFDDRRFGTLAVVIRKLVREQKPVHFVTVLESMNGHLDKTGLDSMFITSLGTRRVGLVMAEHYAGELWQVHRQRKLAAVLAEAMEARETDPGLVDNIIDHAHKAIGELLAEDRLSVKSAAEILAERKFNPEVTPPVLRPIYTLGGTVISTPGNVTSITSTLKTGKSAVVGAMAASAMSDSAADCLGFVSANKDGRALLLFDSEQSPDDFHFSMQRISRRAGIETPPAWFHSYCLTGLGWKQAWECVLEAVRIAADTHQGIHSIELDGAADFVADVNNPAESNDRIAELHDLAIKHDCPIIGVIHFNPGTDKSRGHFGSQLERKAETNLRLDKEDGITTIWSDKNRRAPIPKDFGPCFRWDDEAGMHISIPNRRTSKAQVDRGTQSPIVRDLFSDRAAMRYTDLLDNIKQRLKVSQSTAERKITQWRQLEIIRPTISGLYEPST
jgi:hypothetical protein